MRPKGDAGGTHVAVCAAGAPVATSTACSRHSSLRLHARHTYAHRKDLCLVPFAASPFDLSKTHRTTRTWSRTRCGTKGAACTHSYRTRCTKQQTWHVLQHHTFDLECSKRQHLLPVAPTIVCATSLVEAFMHARFRLGEAESFRKRALLGPA